MFLSCLLITWTYITANQPSWLERRNHSVCLSLLVMTVMIMSSTCPFKETNMGCSRMDKSNGAEVPKHGPDVYSVHQEYI